MLCPYNHIVVPLSHPLSLVVVGFGVLGYMQWNSQLLLVHSANEMRVPRYLYYREVLSSILCNNISHLISLYLQSHLLPTLVCY